jgi:hypothetical protein
LPPLTFMVTLLSEATVTLALTDVAADVVVVTLPEPFVFRLSVVAPAAESENVSV